MISKSQFSMFGASKGGIGSSKMSNRNSQPASRPSNRWIWFKFLKTLNNY
jgi:hypothetical protein